MCHITSKSVGIKKTGVRDFNGLFHIKIQIVVPPQVFKGI